MIKNSMKLTVDTVVKIFYLKKVLLKMDEKQMNCKCVCKYLWRQLFLTFSYKRKKNA